MTVEKSPILSNRMLEIIRGNDVPSIKSDLQKAFASQSLEFLTTEQYDWDLSVGTVLADFYLSPVNKDEFSELFFDAIRELIEKWSKTPASEDIRPAKLDLLYFLSLATPKPDCMKDFLSSFVSKHHREMRDFEWNARLLAVILDYEVAMDSDRRQLFHFWSERHGICGANDYSNVIWSGMLRADPDVAFQKLPTVIVTEKAADGVCSTLSWWVFKGHGWRLGGNPSQEYVCKYLREKMEKVCRDLKSCVLEKIAEWFASKGEPPPCSEDFPVEVIKETSLSWKDIGRSGIYNEQFEKIIALQEKAKMGLFLAEQAIRWEEGGRASASEIIELEDIGGLYSEKNYLNREKLVVVKKEAESLVTATGRTLDALIRANRFTSNTAHGVSMKMSNRSAYA